MRALFHYHAIFKHHNPVRIRNSGQAVCDGDHRAALPHRLELCLNFHLGLGVQRTCRLVQHQNRRVLQQGAGNPDPLFFAA